MAKALGATDVCLPSAGNAGSALAAYAAAAGLRAHVFLPRDIARLFVLETEAYGAHVEMVDGLITDAGRVCAAQAKEHGWYECATLKEPYRVEGKKTMGYEIAEQIGWTLPDAILYPTGGGTGLVGMWKAFAEMEAMGFVGAKRPRMYAVQAEGCAPIVKAFQEGREDAPFWENATTHAHGLRVPKALGDFLILRGLRESHGAGDRGVRGGDRRGRQGGGRCRGPLHGPRGRRLRRRRAQAEGVGPPVPGRHGRPLRHRHRLQVRREHGAAVVTALIRACCRRAQVTSCVCLGSYRRIVGQEKIDPGATTMALRWRTSYSLASGLHGVAPTAVAS